MTPEIIALLANLALTLSLIVAVIFGIVETRRAKRDREERLTLEALRNFQTREFAELINYVTSPTFPDTYEKWLSIAKEEKVQFIQLAQQMESLGIGLAAKFIDFDLLDKTLGSFVTSSWEKYKPIIIQIRMRTPDPYLTEYFQWMAEVIEKRMNESPRTPFYESSKHK